MSNNFVCAKLVFDNDSSRSGGKDEITQRTAEPYALKEFKNRWYVMAKDSKDGNIKSFALDRHTNLDITKRNFESPKIYI